MERDKKIDIEPLGEQRWSRIEHGLFDRVAKGEAEVDARALRADAAPRWRMAPALVLAGAIAAIGGAVAWRALTPAQGPGPSAAVMPSRITTDAAGSRVTVGETTLDVAPQSIVSVTGGDEDGVTVVLERGRVECDVPPRRGRPPFAVQAGDVRVRVVGTHFAVARSAADVGVDVQHGVVEITASGTHTNVRGGEHWPATAASAVPSATPGASASANPATNVAEPAASATEGAAPPASAPVPPQSPRDLYESASRLEATRPDLAIARYRGLAAKGGPWGMNALFAAGRLEADRGHATEARRLLEDYLARYPEGPNAGDARQLVDRLR